MDALDLVAGAMTVLVGVLGFFGLVAGVAAGDWSNL